MDLVKQTRTLGTEIEGLLIGVGQIIVAGLILSGLQKLGRFLAVRLSYPWELFQVKALLRVSREFLFLSMLYPILRDSRKLSPLFPILRFYLRGLHRLVWVVAMPTVQKPLADVSQHNLGNKGLALTMASRSAKALAEEFSTAETEHSWFTSFLFSSMFQLASMTIVDPSRHSEQSLLDIRNRLVG